MAYYEQKRGGKNALSKNYTKTKLMRFFKEVEKSGKNLFSFIFSP
jgi:hypothetical protein